MAASYAHVCACSEYVSSLWLRMPPLICDLVERHRLLEVAPEGWIEAQWRAELRQEAEPEFMAALRAFRHRHSVRIAWRDIAGWATLEETLRDLSDLADASIRAAYEHAYASMVARYGVPQGRDSGEAQPLMILAMGKLGGRELNFSSDIDLVLLYPEEGETDGARPVDNAEFFLRVSQKVAQLLATPTVDGFAYRVDLRLRPFGDSGRVAISFDAFENYLQQHGRDWERYAYVKARAVTATDQYESLYRSALRPFVYRRYLDFGVFESLRDMKSLIAREVERRELQENVKLGPGGIREIEFIVQAFQLIRGGTDPRLQSRELRHVLPLLIGERLLRRETVAELGEAYDFLRRVENRLQEWKEEQTHLLPEDAVGKERLALSMQMSSWQQLSEALGVHRDRVSKHFAFSVFGPTAQKSDGVSGGGFELDSSREVRESALQALKIADRTAIAEQLEALRTSAYYKRLDETGRRRLKDLLGRLLAALASKNETVILNRVLKILEMIGGRTSYLALLNENAAALDRLVSIAGQSQFLADQIAAHPLLLDELIDERLFDEPPTREQFAHDLAVRREALRAEDPERQVEALRQFQRASTFRVAIADLLGGLPLMKVSDRLTDIAELIVEEALALAWTQITARHGVPHFHDEDQLHAASMIVVAYGKLGGLELGYGSDLDLVFLHNSRGEDQRTDGEASVENSVFFQRLGQRLVHLLTVHTALGRLYEVDTRLRPAGSKGLLVQSLSSFREYEFREAWTWEHQSLLRARAIVGEPHLREEFEAARIEVLRKAVRRDDLQEEVRKMRERMRANLSKAKAGQFDLKQDAGGVADLEFLVQFWMLKWADRYPEIVTFSDNIRQLESLASGNLVPQTRVDFLVNTYRKYRQRLHRLSLDGEKNLIDANEFEAERRGVIEIWQEELGG
ncbi:MAG TPA: bifunctional [glutamate--ammonia ligase]-adenylyl-L-tyrosine phosphorylase/[glutamate--ammonia-ligase] adenylyltransferase [Steroidobacteraceae bacterium]|nr:bifunctional [glutamate--ammonia ligase]-adenylyl-L-tyrosine phosphorylase/[glutamate--ammonia-ligase] adenylyltransferase [Steroidobacteraceae bacterium]